MTQCEGGLPAGVQGDSCYFGGNRPRYGILGANCLLSQALVSSSQWDHPDHPFWEQRAAGRQSIRDRDHRESLQGCRRLGAEAVGIRSPGTLRSDRNGDWDVYGLTMWLSRVRIRARNLPKAQRGVRAGHQAQSGKGRQHQHAYSPSSGLTGSLMGLPPFCTHLKGYYICMSSFPTY